MKMRVGNANVLGGVQHSLGDGVRSCRSSHMMDGSLPTKTQRNGDLKTTLDAVSHKVRPRDIALL